MGGAVLNTDQAGEQTMCVPPPPSQAVAIAYRAGILRDEHFLPNNTDDGSEHMRGAAQLKRLDLAMRHATGLPVIVADDPEAAVVTGAGKALAHIDFLRAVAC